ncbi:N-acetyltransferase [Vibrio quintilis]|uniref:Putative N-acetyltransferase YjaB n=1 Tax=Vibrio quintilis TaxID=1117707 RepID=A0A1M7YPM9_9VIBR|nr:N-acetyltransferase [Vibrio quintilis]SHO54568.1 putative N-acetyltransferase YjaB [Vibrio quintilis]
MIRQFTPTDTDTILDIWLTASIQAHDFVDAGFWISQTDNMRDIYLPMAETWVYEQYSDILGFCSLYEQTLAALFVAPAHQHSGIGTQLINHAKKQQDALSLSVYKRNTSSTGFYLSQGFIICSEQTDPHTGQPEYLMRFS